MTKQTTTMSPSRAKNQAEDPTTMQIRAFLADRGIARHKQAAELAKILNVDRSTVFRRFKGEFAWAPQDLKDIAAQFQITVEQMLSGPDSGQGATKTMESAVVRIPGLPSTGEVIVGSLLEDDDVCDLVAIRGETSWEVYLPSQAPEVPRYALRSLTLSALPHIKVALLEDDDIAAAAVVAQFGTMGLAVHRFATSEALFAALEHRTFQAFVLDWSLGGGRTAASAIEAIRGIDATVPIFLITGILEDMPEAEDVILPICAKWNVRIDTKPFRLSILAGNIRSVLLSAST